MAKRTYQESLDEACDHALEAIRKGDEVDISEIGEKMGLRFEWTKKLIADLRRLERIPKVERIKIVPCKLCGATKRKTSETMDSLVRRNLIRGEYLVKVCRTCYAWASYDDRSAMSISELIDARRQLDENKRKKKMPRPCDACGDTWGKTRKGRPIRRNVVRKNKSIHLCYECGTIAGRSHQRECDTAETMLAAIKAVLSGEELTLTKPEPDELDPIELSPEEIQRRANEICPMPKSPRPKTELTPKQLETWKVVTAYKQAWGRVSQLLPNGSQFRW